MRVVKVDGGNDCRDDHDDDQDVERVIRYQTADPLRVSTAVRADRRSATNHVTAVGAFLQSHV